MRNRSHNHILQWKNRHGNRGRFGFDMLSHIDELNSELKRNPEISRLLIECIPLRLFTILEVFLREVIRELVDSGDPYLDRAEKLVKNIKLDFNFAKLFDKKILSIGDFVAHSISMNSLEYIVTAMDTLVHDFTLKLKSSHPRWTEEVNQWPLPSIIDEYDATMGRLNRLFEVRHILAHELPEEKFFEDSEVDDFIDATRKFVEACDWLVVECLHDSVPQTQTQMNIDTGKELEEVDKEILDKVSAVKQITGINQSKIEDAQTAWEQFVDAEAELVASYVEGGSLYPMFWAATRTYLIKDRIDQLDRILTMWKVTGER